MAVLNFLKSHWDIVSLVIFWLMSLLFESNRRMARTGIAQQKGIPEWAVTIGEKETRRKQDNESMRLINLFFIFSGLIIIIGNRTTFSSSVLFLIIKILILVFLAVVFVIGGYRLSKSH